MNRRSFVKYVALAGATPVVYPAIAQASVGPRASQTTYGPSTGASAPRTDATYFDGTITGTGSDGTITVATPSNVSNTFTVPDTALVWRNGDVSAAALSVGDQVKLQTDSDFQTVRQIYANLVSRRGIVINASSTALDIVNSTTYEITSFSMQASTETVPNDSSCQAGQLVFVIAYVDPDSGDHYATHIDVCTPDPNDAAVPA